MQPFQNRPSDFSLPCTIQAGAAPLAQGVCRGVPSYFTCLYYEESGRIGVDVMLSNSFSDGCTLTDVNRVNGYT